MSKRTKAVDVDAKTRAEVLARDMHRCIFCKRSSALTMAHVIPRSAGGLGIKENLVTACSVCHWKMDNTGERETLLAYAQKHLDRLHPRVERTFKK